MQQIKYRPDIDGLRAVAVLSVIFFHFRIPGLEGGFVGVDIFYVISGFLIGSIILRGLETNNFSFSEFYQRRIARLYPAYFAMMCFTMLTAYWLFLPQEFRQFGKSVVASVAYVSNILFYRESGYFDTSANLKPLLHTWSLSTEEQFYIFFPVFAWLIFRLGKREYAVGTLVAVAIISLALSAIEVERNSVAAFYLFQFRAWELLIGVILASRRVPYPTTLASANIFATLGLISIALAVGTYNERTKFPGLTAVLPCLGAALIIHCGSHWRPLINHLLSQPGPVFVGLISYSLYLWHWPLIVFARYYTLRDLDLLETTAVIAATFSFAIISWRFVERPFRLPATVSVESRWRFFATAGVVTTVLAGGGVVIHQTNGLPGRLPPEVARMAEAATDFFQNYAGCVDEDNTHYPGLAHCAIGDPYASDKIFFVWGDSHARAFKNGLDAAAKDSGKSGILVYGGGCPPLFGVQKHESATTPAKDAQCSRQTELVRRLLESSKKVDSIILISRWSYYTEGKGVGVDEKNTVRLSTSVATNTAADQKALFSQSLLATVRQLTGWGTRVFLVEQVPEIPQFDSHYLGVMLRKGALTQDKLNRLTNIDYGDVLKRQEAGNSAMNMATQRHGAQIVNTHSYFCRHDKCSAMVDGVPVMHDNNHITVKTSVRLKDIFVPAMRAGLR